MSSFWIQFITALLQPIATKFPFLSPIIDWLTKQFLAAADGIAVPDVIRVGALNGEAPPSLVALFKSLATSLVNSALARRPVLLRIALEVINDLPDAFFNDLWDNMFGVKKKMAGSYMQVSAADLAACEKEMKSQQ